MVYNHFNNILDKPNDNQKGINRISFWKLPNEPWNVLKREIVWWKVQLINFRNSLSLLLLKLQLFSLSMTPATCSQNSGHHRTWGWWVLTWTCWRWSWIRSGTSPSRHCLLRAKWDKGDSEAGDSKSELCLQFSRQNQLEDLEEVETDSPSTKLL